MINETPLGNIQSTTFRPTESEKLILLNIADLLEQGRTVTQQDAINISKEELEQKQIGDDNLEAAFVQLLKLKMIEFNPNQTIQITSIGQPIVDEARKAQDQEALTAQTDKNKPTGETPQSNPVGDMQQPNAMQNPTFSESFLLIKFINDLSKFNN